MRDAGVPVPEKPGSRYLGEEPLQLPGLGGGIDLLRRPGLYDFAVVHEDDGIRGWARVVRT